VRVSRNWRSINEIIIIIIIIITGTYMKYEVHIMGFGPRVKRAI